MKAEDGLREIITNWGESIVADKGLIDDLVIQILAWHKIEIDKLHEYYKDLITQVHNDNKL